MNIDSCGNSSTVYTLGTVLAFHSRTVLQNRSVLRSHCSDWNIPRSISTRNMGVDLGRKRNVPSLNLMISIYWYMNIRTLCIKKIATNVLRWH